MKKAGNKHLKLFSSPISLSFFSFFFLSLFSGTLLGGGGLKPPKPPSLGCAPGPGVISKTHKEYHIVINFALILRIKN